MTEITGHHVFWGTTAAFGVILAVNVTLAWQAIATFPGLEAKNGYVASQSFDADRRAQVALGWTARASHDGGTLRLALTDGAGRAVAPGDLVVLVGRPTEAAEDRTPALTFDGTDWTAPMDLGRGKWMVLVTATAPDGTRFRQRLDMVVKG